MAHLRPVFQNAAPSVCKDYLTLALCKQNIRRRCSVGDYLIALRCKRERVVLWWCRISQIVLYSEYFDWCSKNSPRRIHCKENPLGDCVWGPDGYRTLGCYETYPTEVLHISDDNFVVIADEFSYYGFSPDAPQYDWLPKMARGYRVLDSSNVCDLKAGVREPSPVTGDTVLPPRSPVERYDDLPLLGSDADGYFDKHGRRHYFCYSV